MTNQALPTKVATVRFSNRNQNDFTRTLRKRVDNYFKDKGISRNANTTMVMKTVVFLTLYIAPFIGLLVFEMSFGVSLLLWAIMGFAVAGIGMSVMHDANHGAYSRNPRINYLIGLTLNMCGGAVVNWKMQHNVLHHTYTNIAGKDNDIDGAGTMRFHPHGDHQKHHKYQWFYAFGLYAILTLFWATAKDFIQYYRYKNDRHVLTTPKEERTLFLRIVALKVLYFGVFFGLPMALGGFAFWQVLIGFVIMNAISGLILSLIFQMAHVVEDAEFPLPDLAGNMEDSFMVHQLKTTSNFATKSPFLTWFSGGLNFQVEHHLFPNICHVHYPEISKIVKETATEYGFPYNEEPTFGSALKSHIRMLKRFGIPSLNEIGG